MALHLRSNPAPMSGALFVSNPRKRKVVRKNRKKVAVKKLKTVRKRKNVAKKRRTVRKNRKNPVKAKKRVVRKRKNVAKKRVVRKTRKNPIRKRKNVAKKRRMVRKNRRNPVRRRKTTAKRRMVRKNRRNPVRKRRNVMRKRKVTKRRNPVRKTRIIRKNPMTFGFLKPVEGLAKKIPVIGKHVAPFVQPAVGMMIGGAGVFGTMASISRLPLVGEYAKSKFVFGNAFGATVAGIGLAVLTTALLPKKLVSAQTKKALAISFAGAGGAFNAIQLMTCGFDLQACADQNLALMGGAAANDMVADPEVAGLGDGMYYEVQPLAGVAMDMAGIDYQSAELGDACSCPSDLSVEEGRVAVQGREAFLKRFGMPSRKMAGAKSFQSKMAGRKGHRWGWLIKSLGYERFKQLAQMPAKQRKDMIAKLKASAIQASRATFDQELTGGLQGIAMSGLAMDMSGLAVDNMAGIAVAGAGI